MKGPFIVGEWVAYEDAWYPGYLSSGCEAKKSEAVVEVNIFHPTVRNNTFIDRSASDVAEVEAKIIYDCIDATDAPVLTAGRCYYRLQKLDVLKDSYDRYKETYF